MRILNKPIVRIGRKRVEKMKSKKEIFLDYLKKHKGSYSMFYVIIETLGSTHAELIVNPYSNYEKKADYYDKSYDDDLVLKAYNGIKIIGYDVCYDDCTIEEMYENPVDCKDYPDLL